MKKTFILVSETRSMAGGGRIKPSTWNFG